MSLFKYIRYNISAQRRCVALTYYQENFNSANILKTHVPPTPGISWKLRVGSLMAMASVCMGNSGCKIGKKMQLVSEVRVGWSHTRPGHSCIRVFFLTAPRLLLRQESPQGGVQRLFIRYSLETRRLTAWLGVRKEGGRFLGRRESVFREGFSDTVIFWSCVFLFPLAQPPPLLLLPCVFCLIVISENQETLAHCGPFISSPHD